MINLLKAEFSRLFKNKIFWLLSTVFIIASYFWLFTSVRYLPDENGVMYFMFEYLKAAPFAIIVFVAFFCGELFSSKTINNLLGCGFSKLQIFLSELIVSITATVIFSLTMIINGLYIISRNEYPAKIFFANIMLIALVLTVFTALSVLVTFVSGNKAASLVILSAVVAVMFFLGTEARLNLYARPEYNMIITSVNGIPFEEFDGDIFDVDDENIVYETIPNPDYVKGVKRDVYEFVYDFLPTTHIERLANVYVTTEEPVFKRHIINFDDKQLNKISDVLDSKTVILDLGSILVLSMLGATMFRKKQIS